MRRGSSLWLGSYLPARAPAPAFFRSVGADRGVALAWRLMAKRALALDLGSSSVRALVFEASGPFALSAVPGALARRPRKMVSQVPGQASFDGAAYFSDLVACLDELHGAGFLDGVSDVALDCQWHSVLAVGADARPRTDVVSWADTRPYRPAPDRTPEDLEELRQRTGCAFAPMYWTWRVPWLRAELGTAGTKASSVRFLGLSEYVGLELLADPSMSASMASATGLLSTREREWDAEAVELAGLGPEELPELASPGWEGQLRGDWARRWPELAAAHWHPATGDGAAANLGVGCDVPSRAAMTIGTSAAVRSVAIDGGQALSPLPAGLWRYCVDHRRTVTGAAYSSGGQLYAWALALWEGSLPAAGDPGSTAGAGATKEAGGATGGRLRPPGAEGAVPLGHEPGGNGAVRYDVDIPVGPGSDGVLVLPWHAGTRPPAPSVPAGRGAVVGLGLAHNGAHIVSAAVEAVCFQLAGGLAYLEAGRARPLEVVVNGGAIERARWWRARLAATLERRILCSRAPETTAKGAVAAALGVELGAGAFVGEIVEPVPSDVVALARAGRRWSECYEQLLPIAASAGP
jgi:gluconokinase